LADPCAAIRRSPSFRRVVWIERLLRGPQIFGDVLEIHADTGPCVELSSHGIDQHIRRMQMRSGLPVSHPPALETFERVLLALRPGNFNKRPARLTQTPR